MDDRLDITRRLAKAPIDPRNPAKTRYQDAVLLRQLLYVFALRHTRQEDADRIAHDPAFRVAVWDRSGDRPLNERLASQPSASRLIKWIFKDYAAQTSALTNNCTTYTRLSLL